ncbi:LacI family DNA-binding transcriptional regulator [Paenibacillus humicola]|uniref:LacI family DNA-binding transcriptional regulator n=1 Tax=Paenibacillus humicola TaxID=3110540 RepID=UPI00237A2407|nr:LacI family DNA-binding transcriptional regulator [Paenibacillus humicola]
MATIDDVARASGVSKSTVSSVFSRKRPISKEVTERVLAAAKRLNYKPNYWARSLANRSTRIIGLNLRGESFKFGQFQLSLLNGVLSACYAHGYRLLVNSLSEAFSSQVEHMTSSPVDGEIILDPESGDVRIEERIVGGVPVVIIGRPPKPYESQISYVDNDNAGMAELVTRHLLGMGHRDILFLNAPAVRTVAADRAAGYWNAFRAIGLEPDKELLVHHLPESGSEGLSSYDFARETVVKLLEARRGVTAVIADSDTMALGVYKAAELCRRRIPGELSVLAFSDDSVLFPEFSPPLTGVRLHAEQLGMEAAKLLIGQLSESANAVRRVLVQAGLVVRGSCSGPPR